VPLATLASRPELQPEEPKPAIRALRPQAAAVGPALPQMEPQELSAPGAYSAATVQAAEDSPN
jgi:hypothetical protein